LIIEAIGPEWFKTMGVPIKAGRGFTQADNAQAPKVLIANEALVRRYWPNENPIGKHVLLGRQTAPAEVVGVAADVKNSGLAVASQPQLYLPFPQLPWGNMNLLVRTAVDPHSLVSAVRAQIAAIDPEQPVTGIQTIDELLDTSRAQPRFTMLLLGAFSATALVLAVVGIYGVLAYSVTQRQQEMGVRLALGATRANILRLIVGQGLLLALVGVGTGLTAALALTRVMASMLYGVSARDFTTFALAPLAFVAIALLASYLPARRATRADPREALRRG
jgi:putative ABC transport system permease protein